MNWNRGHSPPCQGGVAALRASRKWPRSSLAQPGWFVPETQPPRPLPLVAATPPWKGGECPRFQFIHTFKEKTRGHRPRLQPIADLRVFGMRLSVESYWPLIFLAMVPYLSWVRRCSSVDLSAKHFRLSTLVRSVIVCVLTLALMQPAIYRSSTSISVVYLLDVSQSVAPGAIKKGIDWIRQTNDS